MTQGQSCFKTYWKESLKCISFLSWIPARLGPGKGWEGKKKVWWEGVRSEKFLKFSFYFLSFWERRESFQFPSIKFKVPHFPLLSQVCWVCLVKIERHCPGLRLLVFTIIHWKISPGKLLLPTFPFQAAKEVAQYAAIFADFTWVWFYICRLWGIIISS